MPRRLPHRIAVRKYTATVSDYGDASGRTWATDRNQWGYMRPLGGFEAQRAGRDTSLVSHVCEMLYYSPDPVKPKQRLRYDGGDYDVIWVENVDGLKRRVLVYCQRIDS